MSDTERKIVTLKNGDVRYCVLGPKMGVDFHVSDLDRAYPIAGLESHYRECPSYMEGKEPFTQECWLHGGVCWGDGTSLYATEQLLPLFDPKDIESFWPVLENEYRRRLRDAFGDEA